MKYFHWSHKVRVKWVPLYIYIYVYPECTIIHVYAGHVNVLFAHTPSRLKGYQPDMPKQPGENTDF